MQQSIQDSSGICPPTHSPHTVGCILAGGHSSRMGGEDKSQIFLAGAALAQHTADRLSKQVHTTVLSCNAPTQFHATLGYPILKDTLEGHLGPLAGILSAMEWTRKNSASAKWVLSVSCDTPFFPLDLAHVLSQAAESHPHAFAMSASQGKTHPTCSLWPLALEQDLRAYLQNGGRSLMGFSKDFKPAVVSFSIVQSQEGPLDPFFNINNPEDLEMARSYLSGNRVSLL
ncbi:molybdenum cofactor guanylyltransferase MobA [Flexibacterium corallicola]|uniref:molybdenum cofactor guanylyltransferase MobA n=1 Tax=Flexibacterium corallicola TaxID=3037259 RepID=UPI00286F3304|nr:molybdenum cofactor guanylyltransferase MobA [Pseudovibrio sp. M1P-2-3]